MKTPEFLTNMNWEQLRSQREVMIQLASANTWMQTQETRDIADGIINLIDSIIDTAIDIYNIEAAEATFTGDGIMDCPFKKLRNICRHFLQKFDDYPKIARDKGKDEGIVSYFVDSYNKLEEVWFKLDAGEKISMAQRNSLRMLIKETEKFAGSELYMKH